MSRAVARGAAVDGRRAPKSREGDASSSLLRGGRGRWPQDRGCGVHSRQATGALIHERGMTEISLGFQTFHRGIRAALLTMPGTSPVRNWRRVHSRRVAERRIRGLAGHGVVRVACERTSSSALANGVAGNAKGWSRWRRRRYNQPFSMPSSAS